LAREAIDEEGFAFVIANVVLEKGEDKFGRKEGGGISAEESVFGFFEGDEAAVGLLYLLRSPLFAPFAPVFMSFADDVTNGNMLDAIFAEDFGEELGISPFAGVFLTEEVSNESTVIEKFVEAIDLLPYFGPEIFFAAGRTGEIERLG